MMCSLSLDHGQRQLFPFGLVILVSAVVIFSCRMFSTQGHAGCVKTVNFSQHAKAQMVESAVSCVAGTCRSELLLIQGLASGPGRK